jgi:hypothetical protein
VLQTAWFRDSSSRLEFGLKPTVRISHLTIRKGPEATASLPRCCMRVTASVLGLRCARSCQIRRAAPGSGRDGESLQVRRLSGFTGIVVRRRVRSEVQDGALAGLRMTKQTLERSRESDLRRQKGLP